MKIAILLLAALPLLASGADHSALRGRILGGESPKELASAIVTVSTPSGFVSSVVTDKTGNFSFASLPEGQYDFRVTAHGYAIYEREVTVSATAGVRELDVRLVVPADKQTVSVLELTHPAITQSVTSESASLRRAD